jgi:hypothetical protein
MKILVTVLMFFTGLQTASPQNLIDSVDREIIFLTNNFETDRAEDLIEKEISKQPDNIKYYLLSIENKLAENIIALKGLSLKERNKRKIELNKKTLNYAEGIVEKFEDKIELTNRNKFYLSALYAYLGRMYGVERSWMSAFSNGKEAMDLAEEVVEKDPEFYDAYLVLGMFKYFADRLSGVSGFVASILGFSGDRDKGLKHLKIAAEKGSLMKNQAQLLLMEIHSRMESNEFAAMPYFKRYVEKYPDNYNVRNWYCLELMGINRVAEVKEFLQNESNKSLTPYVKGVYYHKTGNYIKSEKYLEEVLRDSLVLWHGALQQARFMSKLNNLFLEKPDNHVELGKRYAGIYQEYKTNPQKALEIAEFGSAVVSYDDSKGQVIQPVSSLGTESKYLKGLLYYYKGIYEFKKKEYRRASEHFETAKNLNSENFGYNSIKYLIQIYKLVNVSTDKVKRLTEEINEEEYERLSFYARDLKKKYNL